MLGGLYTILHITQSQQFRFNTKNDKFREVCIFIILTFFWNVLLLAAKQENVRYVKKRWCVDFWLAVFPFCYSVIIILITTSSNFYAKICVFPFCLVYAEQARKDLKHVPLIFYCSYNCYFKIVSMFLHSLMSTSKKRETVKTG